jgi:hypothetical protein
MIVSYCSIFVDSRKSIRFRCFTIRDLSNGVQDPFGKKIAFGNSVQEIAIPEQIAIELESRKDGGDAGTIRNFDG